MHEVEAAGEPEGPPSFFSAVSIPAPIPEFSDQQGGHAVQLVGGPGEPGGPPSYFSAAVIEPVIMHVAMLQQASESGSDPEWESSTGSDQGYESLSEEENQPDPSSPPEICQVAMMHAGAVGETGWGGAAPGQNLQLALCPPVS